MRSDAHESLVGQIFGRLTVIEEIEKKGPHRYYLCKCSCGNFKAIRQNSLLLGKTKSCGCLQKEKAKITARNINLSHGDFGTKLYRVWAGIKNRCKNPNFKYFSDYGGRGIKICLSWEEYTKFKEWAINSGYQEGLTIERIDVNGDYEPNNCKWITMAEQGKNKRWSKKILYNGKEYTIKELSEVSGIKERTIRERYNRGWKTEDLIKPVK